jgi:hypothetical protein
MVISMLLIVLAGGYIAWFAVQSMGEITRAAAEPASLEDPDLPERLISNAENSMRVVHLVMGGGVLMAGVVMAIREAARLRQMARDD